MNYFYTNGTPVINSLKVTSEVPLDPRLNVENIAERDSLVTNHISYDRMKVYVKSTDTKYIYHKDTGEWEIDNKYSEDDKAKLDNITDYLIDTEHIYNPENKLLFREHVYTPVSDTNTLRDHILQEARVAENGELYNGLLSKFYVNRLNNVTNYLTNLSFTKATDVADLYLTTHSYNPDNKVITKTNINIPVATDANNGLLSNIQNIKLNRIINYVNDIDTKHTNDATVGLKYNYNIYNPNTDSNVTKTIVIPLATDTENGLQSNIEHIKLGRIVDYMTEFSSYTNDSKGLKYVYKKYNPNTNVTTNHDVIIPLVTHSLNGLLSSTDKIKIDDIETYVKSIALRQASGTEELGIDYVITNPNNQTDTPGFFNLPLVTDLRNGLVSPARKHWMDNANGLSNTGTTSDTWQLKKKDIDTKIDPNGGLILKSSGENLEVRTKTDTGYANLIMNDITIKGNVTQEGSSFITEAETVEVKDNTLLLNRGEVGAGVTKGFAGIEIDRGTLPKFQILFNESDRRFKAGEEGDLWCLALRDNDADMINGMFVSWDSTTKRLKTTNIVPLGKSILFDATMEQYQFNIRNQGNSLFRIETPSISSAYIDLKFVNKATFATGMAGFQFEKPVYISGNLAGYSSTLVFSVDNTLTSKLTINKDKATFSIPVYGTTFYRNSDSSEVLYHADIINNLTSGGADKVLSAEQGKALKKIADDINTDLSTNYLPLTAGSGKALTGMLYADKGVRIPKGESIYTSNIAGTDSVSLVRISSTANYNLSIGVRTATSNEIELVADFIVGTPNDKAGTSLGTSSKRFSNIYAAIGDFSTSVTSLLLKSTGNAEVSKMLSVGDSIQMSNQTAIRIYNGTKYANALWGNDNILTVGQDYPYISIGINNGTNFATFNKDFATLNGYLSVSSYITTPSYISATQGFKVQGNRVTALNRPNVVSMSSEVVSFSTTATNIPGADPVGSGLVINDGFCTTYFWDGDFATQLALDVDGTGVAYRGYTPSTGASIRGWKFLATTAWTNSQLTDIRGKYLPLTGGTLSGYLIFNNNLGLQWKNASGTVIPQMYFNSNNVLVIGNASNAELYLRTGAKDIVHERAGITYAIWDAYNLSLPARLDTAQTFTGNKTFSNAIIANGGIQIGSTADIGWYNYNSRIAAGTSTARGVNVGNLLVSSVWADYTKVPTNGIYSKGGIHTDNYVVTPFIASPNLNAWTLELLPDKTNNSLLQVLDNASATGAPTSYATILQVNSRKAHWATQLYIDQSNDNAAAGKIRYRTSRYDSTTYSPFKVIATEDWVNSNVVRYDGGTVAYTRNLGVNGSQWTFLSNVNATTTSIFAPTTVGTSGQLLQSTGGTPTWIAQSSVVAGRALHLGDKDTYEGFGVGYRTSGGWGGVLIKLPHSATSTKMFQFTVRLYADYQIANIVFSGYLYNSNGGYIYTPRAIMATGSTSKAVKMGKDASNNAYVWIGGSNNYMGIAVTDIVAGHTGGDWTTGWTITESAAGAEITTVNLDTTVYPPATTGQIGNYLPLSGGTLTGNLTLNTNALIATNAYNKWGLTFNSSNTASYGVYMGLDNQSTECLGIGSNSASTKVKFKMGQKTIAAGTFVTITNADLEIGTGYISSPKIIKQGGTSAQFLKADGSVDSNTYITKATADANYATLSRFTVTSGYSTILTGGNEFCIGNGASADMHVNYRLPLNATVAPANWHWRAGTGSSYANGYWGNLYMSGNLVATQNWVSSTYLPKTIFNSTGSSIPVDCNTVAVNGVYYYSTNGPTTAQGASTADGALFTQQYSETWKGQIAQDYRNGNLFVRGKNSGTWTTWKKIATVDLIPSIPSITISNSGSGNAVTSITVSGHAITVTKGSTFLTSHQSIYAATFSAGAFSAVTYTPNSAAKTISIPTHTSHLTNNSGFITSASLSGYIPTSGTSTITTKIVVGGAARNCGIIGTYDSTKTQQIWAMGTSYLSNAAGTDFGGLYGLAYKHTNNTTGGTMAGGHQMVWCQNGSPSCALGDNVWTSGNVSGKRFISSQATGTSPFSIASTTVNTNLNADMVDGQHFSYSNTSNAPTYLWATNTNGTNFLASRTSITVGNATNATTATKWAGYDIWVGTAAQLPASRVATTIYFVKA